MIHGHGDAPPTPSIDLDVDRLSDNDLMHDGSLIHGDLVHDGSLIDFGMVHDGILSDNSSGKVDINVDYSDEQWVEYENGV